MAKDSAKNVQDPIKDSAHKIWLAGLGALAAAGEEGDKLFRRLVEKGETVEVKGKQQVDVAKDKLGNLWSEVESKVDDRVTNVLHRVGVPTREEISKLTKRVEDLARKVEQLAGAKKPAAARKA